MRPVGIDITSNASFYSLIEKLPVSLIENLYIALYYKLTSVMILKDIYNTL